MNKIVQVGVEARNNLIKGANYLADAVKSTLGPYGANAAMEKGNRITNDGVTIAREIWLKDEIENRGICILREAAIKTNDEAGDGTTTAITLAQAILKEAVNRLPSGKNIIGGATPAEIIRTIEKERKEVTEKLQAMAVKIDSKEQLIESALVSVENKELADLIGTAQWELGENGMLIAEESAERECSVEKVYGVRIDNGFGTSVAINNVEKQALEVNEVRTILTNHTVTNLNPLVSILEQLQKIGVNKVAIIARAFTEQAIRDCMENTKRGYNIFPINAPYTDQNEVMKDLAVVLGGTYINTETRELDSLQLSDVGYAERIVAKRYSAVLTGKNDEKAKERVEKRTTEINQAIKGSMSDFEKRQLRERLAQLSSGFAIVKVGATSEVERKYKKDKCDDAVNAVRAALQEGVVKGAGVAFKEISESLPDTYILKKPLLAIYEQIMSTAPSGFMIEDWVRDPVKVLRIALEKACSVSGTFATTLIAIASENPKPKYMQEVDKQDEE